MLLDIIFLDIDGVLNPDKENHSHVFAPECVAELKRILDAVPSAHIVFSTTWRIGYSFFVLGWIWREHGLPLQRVIARTPDIHPDRRGEEIEEWLKNVPKLTPEHAVRHYAVLDDEAEPILKKIPKKNVFTCNAWHGLTRELADDVISHLSGGTKLKKAAKL